MARYSKAMSPAALEDFLELLRGGALVEAAAARVGVAVSSLYCRRKRDPAFDSAWGAAAEASLGWRFEARPGLKPRVVRTKRRVRFGGARRERYLEELGRTCNCGHSAEMAGVHRSTVFRQVRRDPGFERDREAALERGYEALERRLAEQEAEARARPPVEPADTAGRPPVDFDEGLRLLNRIQRPDGRLGFRQVRRGRLRRWSFEEAIALLERRLRNIGAPIPGPAAGGTGGGADGP